MAQEIWLCQVKGLAFSGRFFLCVWPFSGMFGPFLACLTAGLGVF